MVEVVEVGEGSERKVMVHSLLLTIILGMTTGQGRDEFIYIHPHPRILNSPISIPIPVGYRISVPIPVGYGYVSSIPIPIFISYYKLTK